MNWDTIWTEIVKYFTTWLPLRLLVVIVILVVAYAAHWILQFVIRRVVIQIVTGVKRTQKVDDTRALNVSPVAAVRVVQRTRTLGSVLTNIVNVLVVVIAGLLILQTLAPDILGSFALLTAAIGAGLGFGAQNIVKDILNGLFMVMEDQLGVGDIVDTGFASGVVETVGIRITQIRDVNGTLWFVRNGEILRVGNMSQGWARVIIDLPIPYSSDVEAIQSEMLRVATALASSRKWRSIILEKPEIWGLESISAEALVTRLAVKVRVSAKWDFARDLRLHLKLALDSLGVSLTPLNSVVMTGSDDGSDATPPTNPVDIAAVAAAAEPDPLPHIDVVPLKKARTPRGPRKAKSVAKKEAPVDDAPGEAAQAPAPRATAPRAPRTPKTSATPTASTASTAPATPKAQAAPKAPTVPTPDAAHPSPPTPETEPTPEGSHDD
ncbi:mechanosensitive ion channel domain-containing protein [Cryobacterium sp. GrIS_2_6]|uniref:mechanosensitive ion channel family protein n=1 Tax=Cryobacterium sp. GrIS_2_6 TaxID=3162785 RepID=UPI002E08A543|nr:mechanosensitive ion channel domain-containing protein [Cryobacterium psychrotolerans]MEC5149424.1 small conductance mechanosensitive channel [Cryobacterium psychrotolerans]